MDHAGVASDVPESKGKIAKEIKDNGLLKQINEILKPKGYKLAFKYTSGQNPAVDEPFDYKIERFTQ